MRPGNLRFNRADTVPLPLHQESRTGEGLRIWLIGSSLVQHLERSSERSYDRVPMVTVEPTLQHAQLTYLAAAETKNRRERFALNINHLALPETIGFKALGPNKRCLKVNAKCCS